MFTNKNLLKLRENDINNIFGANNNSFFENLKKQSIKSNLQNQNSEFDLSTEKPKKLLTNLNNLKTLKNSRSDIIGTNLKDSKIKLNAPQKLPLDIIVVDPIYSSIQSCGFEVIQTTNSSVSEYEELIKRGVTDTEEFLRFVVISRGDIEPAAAIELAVLELRETLTIL